MGKTIQKSWIRQAKIVQVSRVFSIRRGIPYINTKYSIQAETPMEYVFGGLFKSELKSFNINKDLISTIDNPIKDPKELLDILTGKELWIEIFRHDLCKRYWYYAKPTTEPLWD